MSSVPEPGLGFATGSRLAAPVGRVTRTDRVGVVAECDAGWRARVSCRVHPVLQPMVRLCRRSTVGEPALGPVLDLILNETRFGVVI